MGTKEKPGAYDCYAELAPDEPYFLLRAKDPVAPALVEAWRFLRAGDLDSAKVMMDAAFGDLMLEVDAGRKRLLDTREDKSQEAHWCANDMQRWRKDV